METIPFDEPTDLVAIPVETYTAKRAYQIASEYRRRGVPVVMGGFHATLMPDEVDGLRRGGRRRRGRRALAAGDRRRARAAACNRSTARTASPTSAGCAPTARSSAASAISRSDWSRPGAAATSPATSARCRPSSSAPRAAGRSTRSSPSSPTLKSEKKLFFFVDDNITANLAYARELADALIPLGIRWVTQMSINAAHDEEFLAALAASGCQGVLIGFESLDETRAAQHEQDLQHDARRLRAGARQPAPPRHPRLRHVRLRLRRRHGRLLRRGGGVRHRSPLLHRRLQPPDAVSRARRSTPACSTRAGCSTSAGGSTSATATTTSRSSRRPWRPTTSARAACARAASSTPGRACCGAPCDPVNRADAFMFRNFFVINDMHRVEVAKRDHFPLGDPTWHGPLLKAA